MNRVALLVVLVAFLCIAFAPTVSAEAVSITNSDDLHNVSEGLSEQYVLGDGIDMTGEEFEPIGDTNQPFNGSLDGNGYSVTNLTVSRSDGAAGLFGAVGANGTVENLAVEDADVNGNTAGAVAGVVLGGTVAESYSTGSMEGEAVAGGLVGHLHTGGIVDSYSSADVNATTAGGLAGYVYDDAVPGTLPSTEIEPEAGLVRSYAVGEVSGEASGGAVGSLPGVTAEDPRVAFENVYWDTDATRQQDGIGAVVGSTGTGDRLTAEQGRGLATHEMQGERARETMVGFDFGGVWTATDSYPDLAQRGEDVDGVVLEPVEPSDNNATDDRQYDDAERMDGFGFFLGLLSVLAVAVRRFSARPWDE